MIVVHYIEKNVELLNQLLKNVPSEGDTISIKGRKGKVLSVNQINDKHVHVIVELEVIKKVQVLAKDDKKRRR
ncbi:MULTISPECIES: hypothetical protein [Bacillaceae]|jgi:hypothetical protein|uniref:Preprotein translocase subunit SecA n=1 Tax=Gottfriedia acidiceleris TaxID=371036 RepID=A0ABY4JP68_9BACI|nr:MULTISPECIES: hypothetical protein [Bacillaceae]KQL41120.1 preprotein translocase subunit SecA [Bacillus sp. FJAT-25509]PEC48268.1 hypothetical protein CON00_17365 [Bacillus sp. AFS096315]PFM83465.1 hypothetical protein COJ46_00225 [Bacillus sp. AFS077874]UPM54880.1 hypothetical protein MY490_03135 [Gottfriedia acidiceleris]